MSTKWVQTLLKFPLVVIPSRYDGTNVAVYGKSWCARGYTRHVHKL